MTMHHRLSEQKELKEHHTTINTAARNCLNEIRQLIRFHKR